MSLATTFPEEFEQGQDYYMAEGFNQEMAEEFTTQNIENDLDQLAAKALEYNLITLRQVDRVKKGLSTNINGYGQRDIKTLRSVVEQEQNARKLLND